MGRAEKLSSLAERFACLQVSITTVDMPSQKEGVEMSHQPTPECPGALLSHLYTILFYFHVGQHQRKSKW